MILDGWAVLVIIFGSIVFYVGLVTTLLAASWQRWRVMVAGFVVTVAGLAIVGNVL